MIRVIGFLVVVAVGALAAAWIADRPGDVAITWLNYRIETSVTFTVVVLVAGLTVCMIAWSLIRALLRSPQIVSGVMRNRRGARGFHAISRGLIAVGSGDAHAAHKFAAEADRFAPDEPLALLLKAQTAQLSGDRAAAETSFRAMAQRTDTKALGLRGLFIEAQRRNDAAAARAFAEEAARIAPPPSWAGQAVLEFRCVAADWAGALAMLERNWKNKQLDRATYRRHRAVLLTAQALAAEDSDRTAAIALALEAVKLAPDLVPAVALAARLIASDGELRKAARMIEKAWRAQPHPELADAYAHLRFGDSARDRLKRVEALARTAPVHLQSALAVARAAVDAREFAPARTALAPFAAQPTQRVAELMSEIEEVEHGDQGRAREWIARAVHAARDPVWTADGFISERWMPVSPVSGRLDAFQWKVPLAELGFTDGGHGTVIDDKAIDSRAIGNRAIGNTPAKTSITREVILPAPPAEPAADTPPELKADAAAIPPAVLERNAVAPAAAIAPAVIPPAVVEPAARAADQGPPSRREWRDRPDRKAEVVIPLVHAPDDPGPEAALDVDPDPAAQPPQTWMRPRT